VATSFAPAIVKLGETIAGVRLETFRIDLAESRLLRAVIEGQTLQATTREALQDFLPSPIVPAILGRLHYEGTLDILTPIRRRGEVVGILSVTSPHLAAAFVPSVKNLAAHVSAALDFAAETKKRAAAENRYRELLESLHEVVFSANADGVITYVSRGLERLGLDPDAVVGRRIEEFLDPRDTENLRSRFESYFRGERDQGQSEYRVRTTDDSTRWLRISSRVEIQDGRPVGIRGSIVDVTEAKLANEALVESERRLSTLMSNLPGMAYRCLNDPNWTMQFTSEGCEALTGYTAQQLIEEGGVSYGSLSHPSDRDGVWRDVQRAVQERRPFELTYRSGGPTAWSVGCGSRDGPFMTAIA